MASLMSKHAVLLVASAVVTAAPAADGDIHFKCKGSQESDGSQFIATTKPIDFDIKVNAASKHIEGGLSEFITTSEGYSSKLTDSELIGTGDGKTSILHKASLIPGAIFALNRHTGSYFIRMLIRFEDQSWTEYKIQATCEVAAKKF